MVTNLTNLTAAKNFYDLVKYTSDVTNGIMGLMFLITIFIIILMMFLRRYTFEESILGSSFLCFAISLGLRAIDLISFTFVISFGIIMSFSGFYVYLSKR